MEDLGEKLAEILNDPESMNRVKQMAESLLGGEEKREEQSDVVSALGANEMQMMVNIMSRLKSSKGDASTQLLTALKPHLSEPRREKVDTAIKILKLIELFPLIKESGLFKI
ncbi:MAG: hypothetical protein IJP22_00420 [Clostridia bacterium]|nr:hypothetical protein [Clostridia bacterium]